MQLQKEANLFEKGSQIQQLTNYDPFFDISYIVRANDLSFQPLNKLCESLTELSLPPDSFVWIVPLILHAVPKCTNLGDNVTLEGLLLAARLNQIQIENYK